MSKQICDKLIKSLGLAAGIGAGIIGFNARANAQCSEPFSSDNYTVALWHFDENQGAVTYGDCLSAPPNFLYANILHFTGNPAPDLWANGVWGSAIRFRKPSYIQVMRGVLVPGTNSLTVEVYVKPETTTPSDSLGFQAINTYDEFVFGLDGEGKLYLRGYRYAKPPLPLPYDELHGNRIIDINEWTYVAFTYDGDKAINLYVNGSLDNSFTLEEPLVPFLGGPCIGAIGAPYGQYPLGQFNGTIEELRVSDNVRDIQPCTVTPAKPMTWGQLKSLYR